MAKINKAKILNKIGFGTKSTKDSIELKSSSFDYVDYLKNKAKSAAGEFKSYIQMPGQPVWSKRNYTKFAEEGYVKNVIAYRCIDLVAKGASDVPFVLYRKDEFGNRERIKEHKLLSLLKKPNPLISGSEFFEAVYSHKMISGNVFIQALGGLHNDLSEEPFELHLLRPDRVNVLAGEGSVPVAYKYKVGKREKIFPVDPITGKSSILHIKNFNPLDDWYGLSNVEAAAYSIDQHNEANKWNQAMLQNGARPSGALMVKMSNGEDTLTDEQFDRLKAQLDSEYTGSRNAGRPLLLEGGLEWKEMSLSPRDMDFLNVKHSAARDIALAFGVPPQMLGIPGDSTYNTLSEARLALWEQTILPMVENLVSALNNWITPMYIGENLEVSYDKDAISALSLRREAMWNRVEKATFLTDEEKRSMLGLNNL